MPLSIRFALATRERLSEEYMRGRFLFKFILFFAVSSLLLVSAASFFGAFDTVGSFELEACVNETESESDEFATPKYRTVVIDAGHGGEDGGASSASGLIEKDVNLAIALLLRDMLRSEGIDVVMTREDDRLLYDRNTDYKGRKKKLDLAARLAIADGTPDAILVSIHMNTFTVPKYSGLQVWYSPSSPDSAVLAEFIRKENQSTLQPDNYRQNKAATSAINLLYSAKCPAVLVECGFLSNPEEASRFETDEYRQMVAQMLSKAVTKFLRQAE